MIKLFTKTPKTPMEVLAACHSQLMTEHPNMYFELAEMRGTGPNAWLTTEDVDDNHERKVIEHNVGDTLIDALSNMARTTFEELPEITELSHLFAELVEYNSYAYFFLYVKPKEGWVLKISTHHTIGHDQYELLVSVTTDNLYDTINQGLEEFRAVEIKSNFN